MQPISNPYQETRIFFTRVVVSVIVMFFLLLVLLVNLVNLQIVHHQHYLTEANKNRYSQEVVAPKRGRIFDRDGRLLAGNELSFTLTVVPSKVKDLTSSLALLKDSGIISDNEIKRFHRRLARYRSFDSVLLSNHLNEEQVAKFVTLPPLSGIDISPYFNRVYPHKESMAHMLGYVSLMSKEDKEEYHSNNYTNTRYVGKLGIEKQYENDLHGFSGLSKVERDVQERMVGSDVLKKAQAGYDLYLTLDLKLQQRAEALLSGKRGAIVLMDVRSGEVLVAASMPVFDPNIFANGLSQADYQKLISSKDKPLFNRVIKGVYPPGSTVKPFVALAALENKLINSYETRLCPGFYQLPNHQHKFRDWKRSGHGLVDVKQSIAESCDVYFYDVAYQLGINKIHDYLTHFGFGTKTGIDIVGELPAVLPSKAWKKKHKNLPWYVGETVIVGIGQGFFTATPIQLAVATAALANNGHIHKPILVNTIKDSLGQTIKTLKTTSKSVPIVESENWQTVLDGMADTIYSAKGTARHIKKNNMNYTLAGKTGTAQVFGLDDEEEYIASQIKEELRDHALFTAYAPIKDPEVAIAVIVENTGSGSTNAAPLAKKIFDMYFDNRL